jgi:hypothetical protein
MNSYWYSHIVHMYVCRYVTREMCYTWDSPDVEIHPVYRSHPPHLVSAGKFPRTQGHHDGAENVGQRWVGRCWEVGSPVRDDMRPRFAQHLWITQSFMAMKSYHGSKTEKNMRTYSIYIGQCGKISEYVLVNQGIFGLSEFQTRHGYNATRYCLHTWSTF